MVDSGVVDSGEKYIKLGDKNLFGDNYIVFNTSVYAYLDGQINKRAEQYNSLVKNHPDVDFLHCVVL